MRTALDSLKLHRLEVICTGNTGYPLHEKVNVWPLEQWVGKI